VAESFSHPPSSAPSIAVIGLACRFPDADDPPTLLDTILTGRRAFRRLPPCRLDLADYYSADPASCDTTYSARAGLIEGWRFDREAFRIPVPAYEATDPAHWLALETAARALAAAGLPGGAGLDRDRVGVIIGNTMAGDASRANALRLRWPYVRRVLTESLSVSDVRADRARKVLRHAAARYLAPFPRISEHTLAGSMPATIPARISSYFGFRGGSHAVDGACASSLQAVASACAALTSHDIDVALTGGVDLSLDPLELVGLAKAGTVAAGDVRIYDENPTGYLPGEGCGMVVLMRTAQARAAGLPVYAEIVGWGTSAGGMPGIVASDASTQLLALRRAYERAGVDPREVQLIEGHGSGTSAGDDAELIALSELRADARQVAALGSIKANIGHAKAAAGAAGLIKTVLALGTGVIPPTTGVVRPHPLLRGSDTAFWLPEVAEEWPAGSRLAGVSAMGVGGINVHLVLRNAPSRGSRYDRMLRVLPRPARGSGRERAACADRLPDQSRRPTAYLLHAPDRQQLATILTRIADVAGALSDAEMMDLACQLGRDARTQGRVRVAIVAGHQEELARLAGAAVGLLPDLVDGLVTTRPGIFAAENADGRITLLLSDEAGSGAGSASSQPQNAQPHEVQPPHARSLHAQPDNSPPDIVSTPEAISRSLAMLRWLESLDVNATAAVGHGLGEIAGLAWAGVLSEADVAEIAALRAEFLSGPAVRILSPTGRHASERPDAQPSSPDALSQLRAAMAQFRFGPPRRRLISTMTGRELASAREVIDLICGGFSGHDRLADAVAAGAQGATLLVETGPGRLLASTAARVCRVPTVGMRSDSADEAELAWAAAALFAAGAVGQVQPLFAGQQSRPIDLWRDQVFITSPCQAMAESQPDLALGEDQGQRPARRPGHPARKLRPAESPSRSAASPVRPAGQDEQPPSPEPASGQLVRQRPASPPGRRADRTATVGHGGGQVAAGQRRTGRGHSHGGHAAPATTGPVTTGPGTAGPGTAGPVTTGPDLGAESTGAVNGSATAQAPPVSAPPAAAPPAAETPATPTPATATSTSPASTAATGNTSGPGASVTADADTFAGVASWIRCFTEELRPAARPPRPADDRPWRIGVAASYPFRPEVGAVFGGDPAAGRALAVLGDPAAPGVRQAALLAAQDAMSTGRLVVITTGPGPGVTGFFASLHAEQPSLGITVLRVPLTPGGLRSARPYASAEPGEFRELVIAEDRTVREPVSVPREVPGGGEFPLGPRDVALVNRACGGAALALAQVLACCGAAVAVIGQAAPGEDRAVVVGLEELRLAGARITYEIVNVADPAEVALAVERIEHRLGPVTAIAHAAGPAPAVPVADLTQRALDAHLAAEHAGLRDLLSPVSPRRLRLILTFGSVAGRYGLPRQSLLAAASAALADQAESAAAAIPGCRALHLELPGWSGSGLGERPGLAESMAAGGTAAIGVGEASRLLLKLLATPELPSRMAVHGRIGVPGPRYAGPPGEARDQQLAGRFLQQARVNYPGIELVCDARLSLGTDPYLADYRVDGRPVLPPTMALEALAQAASALAGRPLRRATAVTMDAPVVLPAGGSGETVIRICALAQGGKITAALRCAETGLLVEHVRAEFRSDDQPAAAPPAAPDLLAAPAVPSAAAAGLVDGSDLHGSICFQSGRFRRIASLAEVTSRSVRALARGAEDRTWFLPGQGDPGDPDGQGAPASASGPGRAADNGSLLLGSPGLNDAALQAVQACVPHRRVWPAACESVSFSGTLTDGAVEIRATATATATTDATVAVTAGPDGPEPPELTWDIVTVDTAGRALGTWQGVRLREAGTLPRTTAWPPPLLSVYLERAAIDLGLDPGLRITIGAGQSALANRPDPARSDPESAGSRPEPLGPQPGATVPQPRSAGSALPPPISVPRQPADPESSGAGAAGAGAAGAAATPLAGLTLEAHGARFAACGWALADPQNPVRPAGPDRLAAAFSRLDRHLSEPTAVSAARLQAVAACLAMAQAPAGEPVTFDRAAADGWALLEAGGVRVACTVVEITGVPGPVAVAILTGAPRRDRRSGRDREAAREDGNQVAAKH
jgi:enediyne polyketide synthase